MVVDGRGAAGQQELGACELRAHADEFGIQIAPDGVQALQPIEEWSIEAGWVCSGQRLVKVMMRIDKPWQEHAVRGIKCLAVWPHWRSAPGDSLDDAIPFNDDPAAGVILSLCLRIEYGSRMTDP